MKCYNKSFILISLILGNFVFCQMRPGNQRGKEVIRQYGFSIYSVADEKSDSIRVLSYLSIPNHVLQFIKTANGFAADYEATVTLKKKKGNQVGRRNWSNTLRTKDYLESTSKKIISIHYHEFKVAPGDYIISAEILDKDSNNSGLRNQELKYSKHKGALALYTPFFLNYLDGNWGLENNEIPMFNNMSREKIIRTSVFVSGKIKPGPYTLEVSVSNSKKKELWKKSFQAKAENKYFHEKIIIPDEVAKQGLRKKVDIILTQGKDKKSESVII